MHLMVVLRKQPPQQGSRVSEARTHEVAIVALCWAGRLCFSAQGLGEEVVVMRGQFFRLQPIGSWDQPEEKEKEKETVAGVDC